MMKWRNLYALVLLLLALASSGCAGMSNSQLGAGGASSMNDCNGDVPSPFPPYCRPVHD
jgi:hypothetical protein